ncbi:unnamed protein product [Adineta steineri]|uniref:F-box domain-containing protein n=1 Tax=Adineta steineri TaxID=433720 RepID=A0A819IAH4_9BILA|nr:unnamed protein product [Adineta steineri]
MKTSIEHLPVELWISIFSYLEAHDLLQAFTNLNHYFNQLIASDYLLFHVRLGKTNHNPLEYAIHTYWSNSILNRIVSLQPINQHKTSHIPEFLRWHCTKLNQLKFLKMKLRGREIPTICNILPQVHSLHHISIECVPNQILLKTILCVDTIRICQLNFLPAVTSIMYELSQMSNIENLYIKYRDDSNNSILNFLLNHMPKLKKLEINSPESYFDNRDSPFAKPLFILLELRTIKIHWSLMYCDPKFFESLHQLMPNLQCFYLNIIYNYLTEDFFNNLVCHWWPTIEKIQQVDIFIKCRRPQITIDNNMQMNVDKFQSTLVAMNDKYNGIVKVIWMEKVFVGYRIIEISICKS